MKLNLTRSKHGFTLVEIMIVVAIIALLAAIAVPNFLRARKRSQATSVLNDLRLISAAVDQYAIDTGKLAQSPVVWADVQNYLKPGTRLAASGGYDMFGYPYGSSLSGTITVSLGGSNVNVPPGSYSGVFFVDGQVEFSNYTFNALSDVAPPEFWMPWGPGSFQN